jgi:ClpX C4-type zinc finger
MATSLTISPFSGTRRAGSRFAAQSYCTFCRKETGEVALAGTRNAHICAECLTAAAKYMLESVPKWKNPRLWDT